MLDPAVSVGTSRVVTWRQADAMNLPFADSTFDVVVCQFGAMFFPDKAAAFAETRRVLRPGGTFLFNVWDRIEDNELEGRNASILDEATDLAASAIKERFGGATSAERFRRTSSQLPGGCRANAVKLFIGADA